MKINKFCILSKQKGKEVVYSIIKKITHMHVSTTYTSYYSRGIRGRNANMIKKYNQ